ncbi:MAG TPA: 4-hydroxythreonine-4-phosphate dehydrogenase PdxA [Steroidobacteraceae bacterium]|nr:4-hydroxythreonine-4-phosphate dehydrogenase PdxA [Steroidobacteraceae bacterium]
MTSGEPAGIGPELCLAVAGGALPCELVCVGDAELLRARANALRLPITLRPYEGRTAKPPVPHTAGTLTVLHEPLATPSVAGQLEPANARYVLALLDRALAGTLEGEFDAIVTAPVHKGIINDAGIAFLGHTEYLAVRTGSAHPVMLLAAGELRVALATTHLPLRAVAEALSIDGLTETARILARALNEWWAIREPRIAVCGVNPHAGEGGYLGDEETRVITPAIARMRAGGIRAEGPLPADTVFVPRVLSGFDAVLAMYHDQGLPVVKHAAFERAVNVTLGLPVLRTSPDHGTSLELAGSGRADPGSLGAAVALAARLAAQRP